MTDQAAVRSDTAADDESFGHGPTLAPTPYEFGRSDAPLSHNQAGLHVRGYKERGTTTTPFDMVMLNDLDRFHVVIDVIDRVPGPGVRAAGLRQEMVDARLRARTYTREHGTDPPEVADWTWS